MSKYWATEEFKSLQAEWYQKLEASGFVDIENNSKEEPLLRQNSGKSYTSSSEVIRVNKQKYYELLAQHTSSEIFSNPAHRLVLELRSNGATFSTIILKLKDASLSKDLSSRHSLRYLIRRYEMKWNINTYLPHQINHNITKERK